MISVERVGRPQRLKSWEDVTDTLSWGDRVPVIVQVHKVPRSASRGNSHTPEGHLRPHAVWIVCNAFLVLGHNEPFVGQGQMLIGELFALNRHFPGRPAT